MTRALVLLLCALLSIWWLWTVPVENMQTLLSTIGFFVILLLLGIGCLSLAGSIRLWIARERIRRMR